MKRLTNIWFKIKWHLRIGFEYSVVILVMFYFLIAKALGKRFYTSADIPKLANIKEKESFDVYIGRPNYHLKLSGIWGNPFPIGENGEHVFFKEYMRPQVCSDHMNYLRNNKKLLKELKNLSGKTLGCYCYSSATGKGKRCHGHNIIDMYKEKVLGIKCGKIDFTTTPSAS